MFDDDFIGRHALAVLRGVRRSTALPFFRRMVDEGLWVDAPWARMPEEQRSALLYGYWVRPGHGTFLKGGKDADGSEVSHWLSWDGLVPAVLQQAERSTDSKWRQAIQTSCRLVACPFCKGSGLGRHASLLRIGPRSLEDWTTSGTVDELLNAIENLVGLPPRADRARARIAACLQPLRSGGIRLLETPTAEPRREALALAARLFAGLPTLFT
jgi:excinuclease UvrABC ATPase subunit